MNKIEQDALQRIESQLTEARRDRKEVLTKVHSIEIEVTKNTSSLEEHMRRTDANETRIKGLEKFKWYFAGIAVMMTVVAKIIEKVI